MKFWLAVGAAWLAMSGVAQARPLGCFSDGNLPAGTDFLCAKAVTATDEPQSFVALGNDWRSYSSAWEDAEGHVFLTGYKGRTLYGRHGDLRVVEHIVDFGKRSQRLVVSYRSVGQPQPVTFLWQVLTR